MLGTYFVLILAMFIVMVVGAVLGYTGFYQISLTYHHSYFLAVRSHFSSIAAAVQNGRPIWVSHKTASAMLLRKLC